MCYWEAQMLWRFPSNNNRDCSQLWMVLVDFSSNKNHESFHNFWNCKEITNSLAPEKKKMDILWSTKYSKSKCESFFVYLAAAHCKASWQWEKKTSSYVGTWGTTCTVSFVESINAHSKTFLHLSQNFGPKALFHTFYCILKKRVWKEMHKLRLMWQTKGPHHGSHHDTHRYTHTLFAITFFFLAYLLYPLDIRNQEKVFKR